MLREHKSLRIHEVARPTAAKTAGERDGRARVSTGLRSPPGTFLFVKEYRRIHLHFVTTMGEPIVCSPQRNVTEKPDIPFLPYHSSPSHHRRNLRVLPGVSSERIILSIFTTRKCFYEKKKTSKNKTSELNRRGYIFACFKVLRENVTAFSLIEKYFSRKEHKNKKNHANQYLI